MTDNPYEAPVIVPIETESVPRRRPQARPVGVSVLAVLYGLGGIFLCLAQLNLMTNAEALESALRGRGIPLLLLVVGVVFLVLLSFSAAIGLWWGKSWGWWLAAFYNVYGVFRNGSNLLAVLIASSGIGLSSRNAEIILAKQGLRIVIEVLVLAYFFQRHVLRYFGLESIGKFKAIALLSMISIAIVSAMWAITIFY